MDRDAYRETHPKLKAELQVLEHHGVEDRALEFSTALSDRGSMTYLLFGQRKEGVASPTGPELNFSMPSVSEVVGWMERLKTLRKTGKYRGA